MNVDENIYELKKKSIQEFLNSVDFQFYSTSMEVNENLISKFKLIRLKNLNKANNSQTLKSLKINNGEEFLMIPHRSAINDPLTKFDQQIRRPTEHQILQITSSLSRDDNSKPSPPPVSVQDLLLQDDMRKIFVTLAQEAAYVLAVGPYANKIIEHYRKRIHYTIKHDKNAIDVMTQLGFKRDRVEFAMQLKANNHKRALDWLIVNESPMDYDEEKASMLVTSSRRNSIMSSDFEMTNNLKDRVDALLEIVNFYSNKDEAVYADCLIDLCDMGYEMEQAREALRVTRNCISAAVAYIEGERTPSIFEIRQGVSASSEIRKKFLETPDIIHSLGCPQMFEFYINILDNPTQAREWNRHSNIGNVMTLIIETYHDTKHSLAVNQFNVNQQILISAIKER
jgi:hypothetical protein